MQNFRLSTAHVKFEQICTLIGCFCWKYIKFYRKGTEELCLMTLKSDVKFEEKPICCSKMTRIWWILIRALKSLKNGHCDWSLSWKVYNFWPQIAQRSYLSWHWRVMQNLKKNWILVWIITWGIWQIFTRALESLKIVTLIKFFYLK